MRFNSIKFEISVLYSLILGGILLIFSTVLYVILSYTLYNEYDQELKLKAEEIHLTLRNYLDNAKAKENPVLFAAEKTILQDFSSPRSRRVKRLDRRWLRRSVELDLSEDYINFLTLDGQSLIHSENLKGDKLNKFNQVMRVPANPQNMVFQNIQYENKDIRLVHHLFQSGTKDYVIQIGVSLKPVTQLLHNWIHSIALSIPIILILTSFVGRLFAGRILSPVERITETARKITLHDLNARVKSTNEYTEMESLVEAFNNMISRLEKSFKHIEEFSAHMAHELKTPLAIIKGEAELALKKERDLEEYKRVIQVNLEEAERMLKTIEDLLLLTKLDYQPEIFKFAPFDFVEFFNEIVEQTKILAAAKEIAVAIKVVPMSAMINGDRLHLRRLFFNIIDNGLKFTPKGGTLTLSLTQEQKKVVTSISDTGPGVLEEDLPKIFEAFYRGNSRHSGNGLGLNIAQSIARLHRGEIRVESKLKEGTTFRVLIPTI